MALVTRLKARRVSRPAESSDRAIRWIVGLLIFCSAVATFLVLGLHQSKDSYAFLGGQEPICHGSLAKNPRMNPPTDYRLYSWQSDFGAAASALDRELTANGFKKFTGKGNRMHWNHSDGRAVILEEGRCKVKSDFHSGAPVAKGWVTVLCANRAPETLAFRARAAIETAMPLKP